jgi:hypothetical protein
VKVPADGNARLNFAPGAIDPEFHAPPSPVDVWAIESSLVHVTVPPGATVTGFGAYAVDVREIDPWTIDTAVPLVAGTGEGEGDVGAGDGALGDEDPHAAESANSAAARMIR